MNILSRADLKALINRPAADHTASISLYMPTHRAGDQVRQDPIRLKNLIRQAEGLLETGGVRPHERQDLLAPLSQLVTDMPLWRARGDGLAVFRSRAVFRYYRVPLPLEDLVIVEDHFHIKPLLPLFVGDGRYYVLAFSQKQVRLFECTRQSVREVDLKDVPPNFDEALRYDQPEKHLQVHGGGPRGVAGGSVFHGQGAAGDEKTHKRDLARFAQLVNHGLHALLKDSSAPLILAAVDYLIPIYREANVYPHLMPQALPGNPDGKTPDDLHREAWAVVEPEFQKAQRQAQERYRGFILSKGPVSRDLREVVRAAHDGRVDALFVSVGQHQWGGFDPETGAVFEHVTAQPGDADLTDLAAIDTLSHGGRVYAVKPGDVPDAAPVAAVFRY